MTSSEDYRYFTYLLFKPDDAGISTRSALDRFPNAGSVQLCGIPFPASYKPCLNLGGNTGKQFAHSLSTRGDSKMDRNKIEAVRKTEDNMEEGEPRKQRRTRSEEIEQKQI